MQSNPLLPGFMLPVVVDPPDTVCFQIPVPNDPAYIIAFYGVMHDLSQWINWQRDEAHTGTRAAQHFRAIFQDLIAGKLTCPNAAAGGVEVEDMSRFRIDPDNCSIIQIECQPGEWEQFYPPIGCTTPNPIQPNPPGGNPAPGKTYDACLSLQGNGMTALPVQVNGGDIITLSQLTGGWTDGTFVWYCPDGSHYLANGCAPLCSHAGGDPLAGACHMSIIAYIDGTYYPTDAPIHVPAGVSDATVTFQANDGTLSDNGGTIGFCVSVKNTSQETFTHHFDFRISDYGFVAANNGVTDAHWAAGQGFIATTSGTVGSGVLGIALDRATPLYGVTLRYLANGSSITGAPHGLYSWPAGGIFTTPDEDYITSDPTPIDFSHAFASPVYGFGGNNNGGAPGDNVAITDLWITAVGVDPF